MSQFYVQRDANKFGAKLATKLTDTDDPNQWIQVTIATANDNDFKQNFMHYQINDDSTVIRGGAYAITIEDVNQQLSDSLDTIDKLNKSLSAANATITKFQNQYKQDSDMTNEAILELSDQVLSTVPADGSTSEANNPTAPATGGGK
ncbi:hypothetical protein IWT25_00780 [Secundilactobacillus pentosiphilus]|uniref:Uncharacterized protein n=1 Tax=Secundilactobacillus pentosiphilus TaxID=1714682 RepID=A0A1Z5IUM2_9LACO|nr:hypothetical protein [Secundilactobacillus pentosiphilus]GAX05474.1 hypothetical protein IWT25_00780 [Secundilactobacillus pentosiphilus]